MLELEIRTIDEITCIKLTGRLDAAGARVFDDELARSPRVLTSAVLDLTALDFLSSAGIASLTRILKESRSRQGHVVLAGVKTAVRTILDITGMTDLFEFSSSVSDSVQALRGRTRASSAAGEVEIKGLTYGFCTRPEARSFLEVWSPSAARADAEEGYRAVMPVSLTELELACGVGALGSTREQASQMLGEFLATRSFVAVAPADGQRLSDFIVPRPQATTDLFVSDAVGVSGTPFLAARVSSRDPISLSRLVDDAFYLVEAAGRPQPMFLGLVVEARRVTMHGSVYLNADDIPIDRRSMDSTQSPAALIVGIACRSALSTPEEEDAAELRRRLRSYSADANFFFHGHAVSLNRVPDHVAAGAELDSLILEYANPSVLSAVRHVELETTFPEAHLWIFPAAIIRDGNLKRIKLQPPDQEELRDEWQAIARQIYRDAARVVLRPLSGGFTSKTYSVESYDREGRKQLPTVLKIGSSAVTQREIEAYHNCVEKFILNNSTTILGAAHSGDWAGLRYNFLGVTGPESRIGWLQHHYTDRPTEEFLRLLDKVFVDILKPWYGQPKWEVLRPYEDHDPRRLFRSILEDAQTELGISPDDPELACPELGAALPNPYHFYKHGYPERRSRLLHWYTGITHGDLNLKNVLIDERENIYIIDFSETRIRNIVSDFARLEPIVKFEFPRLESGQDLGHLLEFEEGLTRVRRLDEPVPFLYHGSDPLVEKAYRTITRLRLYADKLTLFETDLIPYLVVLLEWTLPVVSYRGFPLLRKRLAAYSAALITRQILQLEGGGGNPLRTV